MFNKFENLDYDSIKTDAQAIIGGRASIRRLNRKEERTRCKGGRIHVEASLILGRDRQANSEEYDSLRDHEITQRQEKILQAYAMYRGVWLHEKDIVNDAARELPSGMESRVFLSRDGLFVTKITNYPPLSYQLDDFLDNRITLHNYLFGETTYELLGFLEVEPVPGDCFRPFRFVLKQPFVQGHMLSDVTDWKAMLDTDKRLDAYMEKRFNMHRLGPTNFYNSNYVVGDLHLGNVIETNSGEFFFIDTIPKLNTVGPYKTDGKRRYEEWEVVYDDNQETPQSIISQKQTLISPRGLFTRLFKKIRL
jgi:hypothetical protein